MQVLGTGDQATIEILAEEEHISFHYPSDFARIRIEMHHLGIVRLVRISPLPFLVPKWLHWETVPRIFLRVLIFKPKEELLGWCDLPLLPGKEVISLGGFEDLVLSVSQEGKVSSEIRSQFSFFAPFLRKSEGALLLEKVVA